jgi:hypothetical protein
MSCNRRHTLMIIRIIIIILEKWEMGVACLPRWLNA